MIESLCSDSDIVCLLRMSGPWIRKQRMLRRAGLPHIFTVDPIMIGRCPRYRLADIEAWLEAQPRSTTSNKPKQGHSQPTFGGE
jgi:hypothetical protein